MNRIIEIDNELKELNQRKRKLLEERRRLHISGMSAENPKSSRVWADRVWLIIAANPGTSRAKVRDELGPLDLHPHISEQRLTNILTTLRRRGWTENRGTRKSPKWHALERQFSSPWSDQMRITA